MNIVFMGTPDFAVPSLERLLTDGHTVTLVVTQPDKPQGRRQVLTPSPVKACALAHGIPVFQPVRMKDEDVQKRLLEAQPELIVVVAYGKILPPAVLELPPKGCINVHGSLLPRWRGAAPIQWSVLSGDRESGVTTMKMDKGLDTGDMLMQSRRPISEDMTAGELYDLLAADGAQLLSETLRRRDELVPQKQDDAASTYAPMLDKSLSPLDFTKSAAMLHHQVCGLNPWPAASCIWQGKRLKVYTTRIGGKSALSAGSVASLSPLAIACGDGGTLELLEVQYEGGKRMAAAEFVRGHGVPIGENPA